jgi:histidyl-tRNA synthetase
MRCAQLDAVGQPYRINPRLVRGMDYYNLTVFEWVTDRLGAQGTVCGGGRYDGLIELGGKPAPAVGWGLGIERVLTCCCRRACPLRCQPRRLCGGARRRGAAAGHRLPRPCAPRVSVLLHAGGKDGPGSMKSQFKKADASGARHALVFGADELAQGQVA